MGTLLGICGLAIAVSAGALIASRRAGMLVASIVGALIAGWLTLHHAGAGGESICNVSSTLNCDVVNSSKWSELAGVPIALFGVAFYVAMGILSGRHFTGKAPRAPAVMLVGSVLAVAYDVFLLWAMVQTGAWCLFCITTWVLNLMLLGGAFVLFKGADSPIGPALAEEGGIFAASGLLVLVFGVMLTGEKPATAAIGLGGELDLATLYEQPRGRIELDGSEPVKGDPNARFTIVEWADYECPHCALMSARMPKILEANPDLKLLYKHYPISGVCNEFVEGERHKNACDAAAASECARLQGRFYELSEAMFKNQEYLGPDDIRFLADQHGLDKAAFAECMANPATMDSVRTDVAHGGIAEIDGTPSLFLKGTHGDAWVRLTVSAEEATDAIHAILSAAREGKPLPPAPPPAPHDHDH